MRRRRFALEERFITPEGDYGELETGSTTLAFVSHELAQTNLIESGGVTPLADPPSPPGVSITLVTNDVKATLTTAVEAGARIRDPRPRCMNQHSASDPPWGAQQPLHYCWRCRIRT